MTTDWRFGDELVKNNDSNSFGDDGLDFREISYYCENIENVIMNESRTKVCAVFDQSVPIWFR